MRAFGLALVLALGLTAVASAQNIQLRNTLPGSRPGSGATAGAALTGRQSPTASVCSGHGRLVSGLCACAPGWSGGSCEAPQGSICSGRGAIVNGRCVCSTFWMGPDCSMAGLSITGPVFPQ
jgi:hypothetical protein